jgi:hypothetical protein
MALTVKWSKEAKATYESVISYLKENWTDKEAIALVIKLNPFYLISPTNLICLKHQTIKESERPLSENKTLYFTWSRNRKFY